MEGSKVKGLRVIDISTDEVYDVYSIIINNNGGTDYFLAYNDRLRKAKAGFTYLKVTTCMPVKDNVGLME